MLIYPLISVLNPPASSKKRRGMRQPANAGKRKRGRKHRSPAPEADVLDPTVEWMSEAEPARAPVAQMSEVPESWRIPMA